MKKGTVWCVVLTALMVVLFVLNLVKGSIDIPFADVVHILTGQAEGVKPSWQYIVLESRLPQALTAINQD